MISEHFLIRHLASSPYWFALVAAPVLVYLFVGSLVGRLGDALRGREEAEAVLAELESRHSAVLANLAIGVAVSDTAETITFANPQAEMIFGTEKGTLVGRNLGEFVSDEELAHVRAETERRSRGETSSYEMGIRRASGAMPATPFPLPVLCAMVPATCVPWPWSSFASSVMRLATPGVLETTMSNLSCSGCSSINGSIAMLHVEKIRVPSITPPPAFGNVTRAGGKLL